jgi:hypothetical protein
MSKDSDGYERLVLCWQERGPKYIYIRAEWDVCPVEVRIELFILTNEPANIVGMERHGIPN